MSTTSAGQPHGSSRYEIRIKGHLSPRWATRFDPMTLTAQDDGTTVIEGPIVDQAALHGLLTKLGDLGLPLLSVTQADPAAPTDPIPPAAPSTEARQPPKETDMAALTAPGTVRRAPVDWTRNNARAAGILYLITFAASIPAAFYFLTPVLTDANYIVSPGADTRVIIGCLLDVVNALACIGTAVAVYPVVKRQNESLALGFVTTLMFEAAVIMIGVVSLLAVVTLRRDIAGTAGADQASLVTTGQALVAVRDYTFQFGPNISAALNALMFATLLYRARLVPRIIPIMGLIAAPLLIAATVAVVFGLTEQGSVWFAPGGALIFVWELSVGIYMTVRGFKPSPITATA